MKRLLPVLLLALSVATQSAPLEIEGEIIANRTMPLAPPALQDVWQLSIAELAPEGSKVKAGDVVVRFEVGDLSRQLLDNQNKLTEKTREREQLLLALAERERSDALTTAEARADLEKALRKASQPQEAIRSVDYRKLVVDRTRAEKRMVLQERREKLARNLREAELRVVETEIARLQSEVNRITASIGALSVKAPMGGMMLYRSNFQGEKFAVGTQVWIGMAVAEIPDITSLAVRAMLPERELLRVAKGDSARIRIDTGAGTLPAKIVKIGRVVHSKSSVQPIPVVDLYLEFERKATGIRPGQQVRVELDPPERRTLIAQDKP